MRRRLAAVLATLALVPVPSQAAERTVTADPPVFTFYGRGDSSFVVVICVVRASLGAAGTTSECDVGGFGHSWLLNEDLPLYNVSEAAVTGSYSVSMWIGGGFDLPQLACTSGSATFTPPLTVVTAQPACKPIDDV